jgi:hypothetical protein
MQADAVLQFCRQYNGDDSTVKKQTWYDQAASDSFRCPASYSTSIVIVIVFQKLIDGGRKQEFAE